MKNFYLLALKILLVIFFISFLFGFFYFSRINSFEIRADQSFYKIDANQKIQKKIYAHLETYKGQLTWIVNLKTLSQELYKIYASENVQVIRQIPNRLIIVIQEDQPFAIVAKNNKDFYTVSRDGSIGLEIWKMSSFNFPVLRSSVFWKDRALRLQAIQFLSQLPQEGLFNLQNISEVKYSSKNESFLFFLVSHDFLIESGKTLTKKQIQNLNFTLNYLIEKKMLGRHIDTRFEKKIIVNTRK